MEPTDPSKLARKWADAIPLYDFVAARSKLGLAHVQHHPDPHSSARHSSNIELVARMLEGAVNQQLSFNQAKKHTLNDLIAGRFLSLGRKSDSYQFREIDPSFWIGADVDWEANTVTRDRQVLIDVRVTVASIDKKVEFPDKLGPGRPTKREVIRDAIAKHAAEDPRFDRPRRERYRAYYSYISAQGYDPSNEVGFSEKTLEKYETEFRRRNN